MSRNTTKNGALKIFERENRGPTGELGENEEKEKTRKEQGKDEELKKRKKC